MSGAGLIREGHLFSQHSLGTFARCPRRYLLKYVDRQPWPMPEGDDPVAYEASLARGRVFHQWMVREHLGLRVAEMAAYCEDADLERWWRAARHFPWGALPAAVREAELPVVVPLGGWRLYARYDLLALDPGGQAVVVDWKTLEARPSARTLRERLQTRIYLYTLVAAGQVLTGGAPVSPLQASMFYWFTNYPDEPATVPYSPEEFSRDGEELLALATRIAGLPREDFARTEDRRLCARCNYRSLCFSDAGEAARAALGAGEGWLDEDLDASLDLGSVPEMEY